MQTDLSRIAQDLQIRRVQVENVVQLIDEGNTIPFIARYRRERTGGLDETLIREIQSRVVRLRELIDRKEQIRKAIETQGHLNDDLAGQIEAAENLRRLDDLYLPYKPKRDARATKARERGLEPFALQILDREQPLLDLAAAAKVFVKPAQGIPEVSDVLDGAAHILAERFSETIPLREELRGYVWKTGRLKAAKKADVPEGRGKEFRDYFAFEEPIQMVPPHRILDLFRGEHQNVLELSISIDREPLEALALDVLGLRDHPQLEFLQRAAMDAMDRILLPSFENEVRRELAEVSQQHAIRIGSRNLRGLLLRPAQPGHTVLSIIPGFRTGCRWAVVDPQGKLLESGILYPHPPYNAWSPSKVALKDLLAKHRVDVVALAKGTASRETEQLLAELISESKHFVDHPDTPFPGWEDKPAAQAPAEKADKEVGKETDQEAGQADEASRVEAAPAQSPGPESVPASPEPTPATEVDSESPTPASTTPDSTPVPAPQPDPRVAATPSPDEPPAADSPVQAKPEPTPESPPPSSPAEATAPATDAPAPASADAVTPPETPQSQASESEAPQSEILKSEAPQDAGTASDPEAQDPAHQQSTSNGSASRDPAAEAEPQEVSAPQDNPVMGDSSKPESTETLPPVSGGSPTPEEEAERRKTEGAEGDAPPSAPVTSEASPTSESQQPAEQASPTVETPEPAAQEVSEAAVTNTNTDSETPSASPDPATSERPETTTEPPTAPSAAIPAPEEGPTETSVVEPTVPADEAIPSVPISSPADVEPAAPRVQVPDATVETAEDLSPALGVEARPTADPGKSPEAPAATAPDPALETAIADTSPAPEAATTPSEAIATTGTPETVPVSEEPTADMPAPVADATPVDVPPTAGSDPAVEVTDTSAEPEPTSVATPAEAELPSESSEPAPTGSDAVSEPATVEATVDPAPSSDEPAPTPDASTSEAPSTSAVETSVVAPAPTPAPEAPEPAAEAPESPSAPEPVTTDDPAVVPEPAATTTAPETPSPAASEPTVASEPAPAPQAADVPEAAPVAQAPTTQPDAPSTEEPEKAKDDEKAKGKEKDKDRASRQGQPKPPRGPRPPKPRSKRQVFRPESHAGDEWIANIRFTIVNDIGATAYSTGTLGREELPEEDPATRAAVSVGRRFQEPLSELTKIDPQHLNVGLYQNDVPPKILKEAMHAILESCVNFVGVDLNIATASELRYVSGLNQVLARRIVEYREQNGRFTHREQLKQVEGITDAIYQQAVGFVKITDSPEPLDRTWIHPEMYEAAGKLIERLGVPAEEVVKPEPERDEAISNQLKHLDIPAVAQELGLFEPTVAELRTMIGLPGYDLRLDQPPPVFKGRILQLGDLKPGDQLQGTVENIAPFGAFVSIGLKSPGLVHISRMANRYIRNPYDVVNVDDVVTVWVLSIDGDSDRVSLTMVEPGSERAGAEHGEEGDGSAGRGRGGRGRGRGRPTQTREAASGEAAPAAATSTQSHQPGMFRDRERTGDRRGGPGGGGGRRGGERRGDRPPMVTEVQGSEPGAETKVTGLNRGKKKKAAPPKLTKKQLRGEKPLNSFAELKQLMQARAGDEPDDSSKQPDVPPPASGDAPQSEADNT